MAMHGGLKIRMQRCTGALANFVHRTQAGRKPLNRSSFRFVWRKDIRHGAHRIFGRDNRSREPSTHRQPLQACPETSSVNLGKGMAT